MGVDPPLNNFMGPEGVTVTVAQQLLNTEYLRDDPSSVSRQQIDDVLSHLDLARNTLIARLNHYQLLASGLDAKSAAALAAAAA